MDFVEWCDFVLNKLIEVRDTSPKARTIGADEFELSEAISSTLNITNFRRQPEWRQSSYYEGMFDAIQSLKAAGCIENNKRSNSHWKVSRDGLEHARDPLILWFTICQERLDEEHAQLLSVINQLSPQESSDHVWLKHVEITEIIAQLDWTQYRIWNVAHELHQWGFLDGYFDAAGGVHLTTTYRGCVWETRRSYTIESRFIDDLVAEWETTSVEFKQYLYVNSVEQKAEFIKDILGLANTQASGRRWLIVGFNNKTRDYANAPNPLTQDDLERILAEYTDPPVEIRYEVTTYSKGPVGKLEVLRDPKKLPYRVAKSLGDKLKGDKKQILKGQIFVRHGSQVEEPTPAEEQLLLEEGERARSQ